MFCHGMLQILWPVVFSDELSRHHASRVALEAVDATDQDGEDALTRLIEQVAQQVEQGERVRSTSD